MILWNRVELVKQVFTISEIYFYLYFTCLVDSN